MATLRSPREQLETFQQLMVGRKLDKSSETLTAAIDWMRNFPGEVTPEESQQLRNNVCTTFDLTPEELDLLVSSNKRGRPLNLRYSSEELRRVEKDEEEFIELIPPEGFFRDYYNFTRETESPVVYHFFAAISGLAATINRRCYFPMGTVGKIYPPFGVILLGPSGIKKTSCTDVIVKILTEVGTVPIYSEKITPEALVKAMSVGEANGLIYAPEMSVFMGKQSYTEGLVPLVTRLMDSPDHWKSETIGRGVSELSNVALSFLACSTSDWFVSNTPTDIFGGGFIARNLLIHQTLSPRIYPIPPSVSDMLRTRVVFALSTIHEMHGSMGMTPEASDVYHTFYYQNKMEKPEHEMLESYHQRKGNHAIRLAMLLHLSTHRSMVICEDCFVRALGILKWTEKFLPGLLGQMFKTGVGQDAEKVLRTVKSSGGMISHSVLVRKMQYCMNASQLKNVLQSLKESNHIEETHTKFTHTYAIKVEEVEV